MNGIEEKLDQIVKLLRPIARPPFTIDMDCHPPDYWRGIRDFFRPVLQILTALIISALLLWLLSWLAGDIWYR